MPRPIDATALVKLVLEVRDKIPLEVVERYSFGVPSPNKHGQSMRGGIRKVLRLIEQAPTLDYAPVRHGYWKHETPTKDDGQKPFACSECGLRHPRYGDTDKAYFACCPWCGARMDAKEEAWINGCL